jgi:hypothetical protein
VIDTWRYKVQEIIIPKSTHLEAIFSTWDKNSEKISKKEIVNKWVIHENEKETFYIFFYKLINKWKNEKMKKWKITELPCCGVLPLSTVFMTNINNLI